MNNETNILKLLESSGEEFFDLIEKYAKIMLPDTLKKLLCLCRYDRVASLSQFDESAVAEIEEFYRYTFSKDMIGESATIENYLGIFSKNQEKFIVMSGEKKLLKKVSEMCLQLEQNKDLCVSHETDKNFYVRQEANDSVQEDSTLTTNLITSVLFDTFRSWIKTQLHVVN